MNYYESFFINAPYRCIFICVADRINYYRELSVIHRRTDITILPHSTIKYKGTERHVVIEYPELYEDKDLVDEIKVHNYKVLKNRNLYKDMEIHNQVKEQKFTKACQNVDHLLKLPITGNNKIIKEIIDRFAWLLYTIELVDANILQKDYIETELNKFYEVCNSACTNSEIIALKKTLEAKDIEIDKLYAQLRQKKISELDFSC